MNTRQKTTLLGLLAEGFSLPLMGLAVLVGVLIALGQHQFSQTGLEVKDPGTTGGAPAGPVASTDGAPPARRATTEEIKATFDRGDFEEAKALAKAAGSGELADRATLFHELTRSIQPGALADAESLVSVKTSSGLHHLGVLRGDSAGELVVELPDGHEQRLKASAVAEREELSGDALRPGLETYFAEQRALLGDSPSGLALHRLSFLAFQSGCRAIGTKLMGEALVGAEGGIIVDMFGEGDFARLHRARRVLAGLPEEDPAQVAMLEGSKPAEPFDPVRPADPDAEPPPPMDPPVDLPPPDPVDLPPPPDDPPPADPPPMDVPSDRRVVKGPDIDPEVDPTTDVRWTKADAAYRSGLELYRGSFGVSPKIQGAAIRAAMKEFRRAQDQLNLLLATFPDHPVVGRRLQELNMLVIDCVKRQRIE